jgi:hypothetical protein
MAVTQVTVSELLQLSQGSLNVGIQTVRTQFDYANRKIVTLQKHLQDLKSAYILTLQNVNRNLTKEELDKNFSPDRFQTIDPTQVIKPYDDPGPDPDARINRIRRRLDEITGEQKKVLYNLEEEIKKVGSTITQFTQMRNGALGQLALMENVNIISSRDNIARVQYETIHTLEQISKRYLDLSTDATGARIHSSSPPITRQYKILQDAFQAYASRDPDVLKGNLKLLLEDPGCPENRQAIKTALDRRRAVLANKGGVLPPDIVQLDQKMQATINDSFISQNVSRQAKEKRLPEPDNAVTTLVDNLDKKLGDMFTKANNFLSGLTPEGKNTPTIFGLNVNSFYDSTGFSGAVTNWFNRVMQNNYDNMPLCGITDTSTSQAKTADNSNLQQSEVSAGQLVSSQYANVEKIAKTNTSAAQTALADALNAVVAAINAPAGSTIKWGQFLNIGRKTYASDSYYDGMILDKARRASTSAMIFVTQEAITNEVYDSYIIQLQDILDQGPTITHVGRSY